MVNEKRFFVDQVAFGFGGGRSDGEAFERRLTNVPDDCAFFALAACRT